MSKLVDISLGFVFFIVSIILWFYVVLISSDSSVNISEKEFVISLISLFLFALLYSFYISRSKRRVVCNLLVIPLVFWLSDMINTITYNYQEYHTIISIIGFLITGYCIELSIYKSVREKNKD